MLSIIFGGGQSDAVCCVQRCILFLLYILNCYGLKCSSEHKCGGPKYGQGVGSVGYQDSILKLFAVLDFAA